MTSVPGMIVGRNLGTSVCVRQALDRTLSGHFSTSPKKKTPAEQGFCLVARDGFEPPTFGFQMMDELTHSLRDVADDAVHEVIHGVNFLDSCLHPFGYTFPSVAIGEGTLKGGPASYEARSGGLDQRPRLGVDSGSEVCQHKGVVPASITTSEVPVS